ncbi:MAG: hypothetical protein ACI90V_007197 [Bacillariaceae sp.]|jgi:hypothetical protein
MERYSNIKTPRELDGKQKLRITIERYYQSERENESVNHFKNIIPTQEKVFFVATILRLV